MTGFLRFVGLLNAAIWLGAAVAFSFGALPAAFSHEMKSLLEEKNYPYFSGAIAQLLVTRYLRLQLICAVVGLIHLLAGRLYLGQSPRKSSWALLLALFVAAMAGNFVQPEMKKLHTHKYAVNLPPSVREAAGRSFRMWHGVSQGINLLMMGGLVLYLWRLSNSPEETRFVSTVKLRS